MLDFECDGWECPECNRFVYTNKVDTIGKISYFAHVCEDCYELLESDDE